MLNPTNPRGENFSVMFIKSNVFVKIYIKLKDQNTDEIMKMVETLAKKVENKIVL